MNKEGKLQHILSVWEITLQWTASNVDSYMLSPQKYSTASLVVHNMDIELSGRVYNIAGNRATFPFHEEWASAARRMTIAKHAPQGLGCQARDVTQS